jgi:CTP:molybdopterin cytidylyltransferase MocA
MKPNVAAIVLAAGLSRRMGTCKQLLSLEGQTVIGRCLETLLRGGISEVVVVVGPLGGAVAEAALAYPVTVARTNDPEGDMAASVRTGRNALPPAVSGVLIALCDHPLVAPDTVAFLAALHGRDLSRIIIPVHDGAKGHPTLFPRCILDELEGPLTLRDLVRKDPGRLWLAEVSDRGVRLDMDTPHDYRQILELCRAGNGTLSANNLAHNRQAHPPTRRVGLIDDHVNRSQ